MTKKVTVELPAWLPQEEWIAYLDMRKSIKKPLTEYAKKLALGQLERLQAAGHAPAEVLNQSTFNSWQGLFPVKVIQGLEPPKEAPKPGTRCPHCGSATRGHAEGRQCKSCGRVTPTKEG